MPPSASSDSLPSRMAVREKVLSSRDFSSLLKNLTAAVESSLGVAIGSSVLLLVHPMSNDVRLHVERRGKLLFHAAPSGRRSCVEEYALTLEAPGFVGSGIAEWFDERKIEHPPQLPAALVYIPLREDDRTTASVVFFSTDPIEGDAAKFASSLNSVQEVAELVLSACRELEMLRLMKDNMQEIFEAATLLEGGEDPRVVGRSACAVLCERLGFDRALLVSYSPATSELLAIGSQGCPHAAMSMRFPLAESTGMLAQVFKEAGVRWVPTPKDGPLAGIPGAPKQSHHAVALPLLVDGRSLGVLYGDHLTNRAQISPSRLVSLQLFANNVAARLESARLLAEVGRLAEQDGLTGLPNRRALDSLLRREVARAQRHQTPLSLLMIDIDRFKELNDMCGHLAGDEVLRETAKLLSRSVREMDFVARFGGDEFVIVMPNTDAEAAQIISERITNAVENSGPELNRDRWNYQLSLGLRSAQPHETDLLLQSADTALYKHKEAQTRRALLDVLSTTTEEELHHWNHYLGKLLRVLIEKEPHSFEHSRRVAAGCLAVARSLHLRQDEIESLHLAAMLHDVGKISIPGVILQRAGPLTPHEFRIVQAHTRIGDDLLREVSYLGEVCEIVRSHHERYDGASTGQFPAYPGDLSGDDIPIGARILKVVDSFDAMTCGRSYRTQLTQAQAIEELQQEAGLMFDPEVVRVYVSWLKAAGGRSEYTPLPISQPPG
jgi:diguanylate cyclase (GGDEF)-like protein